MINTQKEGRWGVGSPQRKVQYPGMMTRAHYHPRAWRGWRSICDREGWTEGPADFWPLTDRGTQLANGNPMGLGGSERWARGREDLKLILLSWSPAIILHQPNPARSQGAREPVHTDQPPLAARRAKKGGDRSEWTWGSYSTHTWLC